MAEAGLPLSSFQIQASARERQGEQQCRRDKHTSQPCRKQNLSVLEAVTVSLRGTWAPGRILLTPPENTLKEPLPAASEGHLEGGQHGTALRKRGGGSSPARSSRGSCTCVHCSPQPSEGLRAGPL